MSPTDARHPRGRGGTGFWLVAAAFLTAMASTTLQTPLYPLYQREQGFATFIGFVVTTAALAIIAERHCYGTPRTQSTHHRRKSRHPISSDQRDEPGRESDHGL
jgi:hypothetical protein